MTPEVVTWIAWMAPMLSLTCASRWL